jgi:cell wall-associated NlpC family hydrolase
MGRIPFWPERNASPFTVVLWVAVLAATGCTPFRPGLPSEPLPPAASGVSGAYGEGAQIAQTALRYIGVPYRYGGADPSRGFDCSGLVAFVHDQEGISVPRTAAAQFSAAQPVKESDLRPGDLVFFRLKPRSRDVTHVGIYTGQRRFVHAPQTGRNVGESRLDEACFSERYAGSGRFYAAAGPLRRGNPAGK